MEKWVMTTPVTKPLPSGKILPVCPNDYGNFNGVDDEKHYSVAAVSKSFKWRRWPQVVSRFQVCLADSILGSACIEEPESSRQGHGVLIRCQAPPDACGWCEGQEGKKCRAWGRSPKTRERWDEDGDGWFVDAVEEKDWGHGESHPPPGRLWQTTGCDGRRAKFWQEGTCWECEEGREWSRCWASPRVCWSAEWGGDANRQKGQRSPSPNASCWASLTACGEEAETSSVHEIPAGKAKWGAEHHLEHRRLGMEGPMGSWFEREKNEKVTNICREEVHEPRPGRGRGRCSSSWGCEGLPHRAGREGHHSRLKDPNFTSEVPGVRWDKKAEKWRVYIGKSNKVIYGGCFTEKAAAEAKALELREKHGLQLQVKPVPTLANRYAGLPVFHPKVPYPGVTWDLQIQKWHATCHVGGVRRNFRVRPKDHSEADLERSFKEAVAWKKKQEKEKKRKAVKPKAKPRKN